MSCVFFFSFQSLKIIVRRQKMSQQEIFRMIVNLPSAIEMQFNIETIYDFVIDRVGEPNLCQFKDVGSILNWLKADETLYLNNKDENRANNQVTMPKVLKPGTKITIRKPSPNDIKFNDIESAQAYLSQATLSQSSNDDSEEIDVTTFDYTTPWNQYPIIESKSKTRKNSKSHRILTENQQTASFTCITNTLPNKAKSNGRDNSPETMYQCSTCEKRYKQKSSLNRHEKTHLAKEVGNDEPVAVKKPPNSTKCANNGNHTTTPIICLTEYTEPIST